MMTITPNPNPNPNPKPNPHPHPHPNPNPNPNPNQVELLPELPAELPCCCDAMGGEGDRAPLQGDLPLGIPAPSAMDRCCAVRALRGARARTTTEVVL